jgi:hypothetical protein
MQNCEPPIKLALSIDRSLSRVNLLFVAPKAIVFWSVKSVKFIQFLLTAACRISHWMPNLINLN